MTEKKRDTDRRHFLKSTLAGVAGLTVASTAVGDEPAKKKKSTETAKSPPKRDLLTRKLGRTGIEVPILSMGAQAENPELYTAAYEAGVKHFDTAHSYARGRHEVMLGEVLEGKKRDSFIIGTKVHIRPDQKTGVYPPETSAEPFYKKFSQSLERLKLDYVDILYLHSVVAADGVSCAPLMEAMRKLKKEGKTRFLGISTHTREPEVIHATVDAKIYDVVLTSYNFLQPHLPEVDRAVERAAKAGLGIIAMKTQAGVYFDKEKKEPINMKAALKWALSNEHIHTAIAGFTTFDQLELDLDASQDLKLTKEEKMDLRQGEKQANLYCIQCQKCLPQCPENMEIPTLMRAYMYAYGYRNLAKAVETVHDLDLAGLPCEACTNCAVTCTSGFDIRSKVRDIARLKNVPEEMVGI